MLASTSSVYGANIEMPYTETQKTDHQISIYAATKKSIEVLSHSYSHLYRLPITAFRFFTVYGAYGRPDMAPYKFTSSILAGKPIDVYNYGKMERDFTFIDDLVESVSRLIFVQPSDLEKKIDSIGSSGSNVAPWQVVNIGNSKPIKLLDFIGAIEKATGLPAKKNFIAMQSGDVVSTWADTSMLANLIGYTPNTTLESGVSQFVSWFRSYYGNEYGKR